MLLMSRRHIRAHQSTDCHNPVKSSCVTQENQDQEQLKNNFAKEVKRAPMAALTLSAEPTPYSASSSFVVAYLCNELHAPHEATHHNHHGRKHRPGLRSRTRPDPKRRDHRPLAIMPWFAMRACRFHWSNAKRRRRDTRFILV